MLRKVLLGEVRLGGVVYCQVLLGEVFNNLEDEY